MAVLAASRDAGRNPIAEFSQGVTHRSGDWTRLPRAGLSRDRGLSCEERMLVSVQHRPVRIQPHVPTRVADEFPHVQHDVSIGPEGVGSPGISTRRDERRERDSRPARAVSAHRAVPPSGPGLIYRCGWDLPGLRGRAGRAARVWSRYRPARARPNSWPCRAEAGSDRAYRSASAASCRKRSARPAGQWQQRGCTSASAAFSLALQ